MQSIERHFCSVSFLLIVTYKPFILSVIMMNVVWWRLDIPLQPCHLQVRLIAFLARIIFLRETKHSSLFWWIANDKGEKVCYISGSVEYPWVPLLLGYQHSLQRYKLHTCLNPRDLYCKNYYDHHNDDHKWCHNLEHHLRSVIDDTS
jgi:hypothetical protein